MAQLIGVGTIGREPRARAQLRRANATMKGSIQANSATIDDTDSPYTLPLNIDFLYVNTTAGNVTVNLYATSSYAERNSPIWIKNIGTANAISVTPQVGETIDGVAGARTVGSGIHMTLSARPNATDWSRHSS